MKKTPWNFVYSVVQKIINLKTMENENKSTIWSKILKITITLLTAIATAFELQACGVL